MDGQVIDRGHTYQSIDNEGQGTVSRQGHDHRHQVHRLEVKRRDHPGPAGR
jgi:hypothetical protein